MKDSPFKPELNLERFLKSMASGVNVTLSTTCTQRQKVANNSYHWTKDKIWQYE